MKQGDILKIRSCAWPELEDAIGIVYEIDPQYVSIYFAQLDRRICFGLRMLEYVEVINENR